MLNQVYLSSVCVVLTQWRRHMFESCHSRYQSHSHTSLLLLDAEKDKRCYTSQICNPHVSADMNGNWHSHYSVRQWRLTGVLLHMGWGPPERPFAPKCKQIEIKKSMQKSNKLTDNRQADGWKERRISESLSTQDCWKGKLERIRPKCCYSPNFVKCKLLRLCSHL